MRATWHFHSFIHKIFMEALGLKMGSFSFTWQLSLLAVRNVITATCYRIKSQFSTTELFCCGRLGWTDDIRVTVTLVCKRKTWPGGKGSQLWSINWGSATCFRPFHPTHKYYQWISIVQTLLLDFQEMLKTLWLPYNLDLYDNLIK